MWGANIRSNYRSKSAYIVPFSLGSSGFEAFPLFYRILCNLPGTKFCLCKFYSISVEWNLCLFTEFGIELRLRALGGKHCTPELHPYLSVLLTIIYNMDSLNLKWQISFLVCLFFWDKISLCSFGCPGAHFVEQSGLRLTKIHLPLPPKCWD